MRLGNKDLSYYTGIITLPFVILVAWSAASLIAAMIDKTLIFSTPWKWAGFLVPTAAYAWTGWSAVRGHGATTGQGGPGAARSWARRRAWPAPSSA